jgi:uncharacterized protein YegL
MRRLPVFFVLDCSESMVGENLKKMEDGILGVVRALRADPHALETVFISVIAFAGVARTIAPLVDVVSFYPPRLPLGGGTSLGTALTTLMAEIDRVVIKTTPERKGDWKPIVYLFTDGRPTDDPSQAIKRWKAEYGTKANLIAIGLGKGADLAALQGLTETVIVFEDAKEGDFKKFINWVTASVVAQSRSVGENKGVQELPLLDESVMRIIKEPATAQVDESCVTLVGRCQKTRRPYIMKYERVRMDDVGTRDFKVSVSRFDIAGCYPLDEEYFAWSDPRFIDSKVNSSELMGSPGCPHCGNYTAFAMCGCGKLMCINGPGPGICPWCDNQVNFSTQSADDEHGFDVSRGRG